MIKKKLYIAQRKGNLQFSFFTEPTDPKSKKTKMSRQISNEVHNHSDDDPSRHAARGPLGAEATALALIVRRKA